MFELVEQGQFDVSLSVVFKVHRIAAKEEALELGKFRTGGVLIAVTDYALPSISELPGLFTELISDMHRYKYVYDQAIHLFLTMARCQFFYDEHKPDRDFLTERIDAFLQAG